MLDSVPVAQAIVFQRELKAVTKSRPLQVSSFVDLPTELTADGRTFSSSLMPQCVTAIELICHSYSLQVK